MNRRILIMAGGTGGHVFPGLAVATALQQQGWQIRWLGTATRMEATLVPQYGYDMSFIDVEGVRGNGFKRMLKAPFQILRAILQSRSIIKEFEPDVVLGLGGFASGPGGIAAWMSGVPLILHEQNAVAGVTNKILAKFASKVLTGFPDTFSEELKDSEKYQYVGNPIRSSFAAMEPATSVSLPLHILVVGGSLGAQALNDAVPEALEGHSAFLVRHQCGAGKEQQVTEKYTQHQHNEIQWQVEEFIDDMPQAFAWADLVICRAGALTVAEVAAAGKPAIFVPLPQAVDDHQTKNAQSLADSGAAFLLSQQQVESGQLSTLLNSIFAAPEQLLQMGEKARKLARFDATEKVAYACTELAEKRA